MAEQIVDKYILETDQAVNNLKKVNTEVGNTNKLINNSTSSFEKLNKEINTNIRSIQSLNIQSQSFQAIIEKATDPKVLVEYNKKLEQTKDQINKLSNAGKVGFDELGNKIQKSEGLLKQFTNSAKNLLGVLGVAFGVQQLVSFGKELVVTAAKVEGITTAFNKIAPANFLQDLRDATKNTVNDFELMKLAVNASNFQIPLETFGTLLKFAQQRARETGQSVDYLVNSITLGIARRSPLILDNLGINIKRIREEFQLTGDFSAAALKIINEELEKQGDLALTTADRIDQFATRWDNFKVKAGNALVTTYDLLFNTFSKQFESQEMKDFMERALIKPTQDATKSVTDQIISLDSLRTELQLYTDILNKSAIGSKDFVAAQKEILRIQNAIDEATGVAQKKRDQERREAANRELELNKKIAEEQIPGGGLNVRLREDEEYAERNKNRLKSLEKRIDDEYKAQQKAEKDLLELQKAAIADAEEFAKAHAAAEDARNKVRIAREKYVQEALFDLSRTTLDNVFQLRSAIEQSATDQRIRNLEAEKEKELEVEGLTAAQREQIQKDFDEKRSAILNKNAEVQRKLDLAQILVTTALAVIRQFATGDPLSAPIRAALAAAEGAIQYAFASSQPLPKFAKGTERVIGGKKGQDSVLAMLTPDEAIITAQENMRHPGLAKAWNAGKLEQFLAMKYIEPMLNEVYSKDAAKINNQFINNNKISGINDKRIVKGLQENTAVNRLVLKQIKNNMSNRSDRRFWN